MARIPRVVLVLAAARFATACSSFLVLFLTLYLNGPRSLGVVASGLIAGSYGVGMLAGNFTGGRWGDRFGHGRVLLWCSAAAGLGVIFIPWLPTWLLGVALAPIAYLGSTADVSVGALTALAVPRGDRRASIAIGRAASNAGYILGPLLAAWLLTKSWILLFMVDGAMLLAIRVVLGQLLPDDSPAPMRRSPGLSLWSALRADRSLMRLLPAVVLVDIVYRQLYTTLPLHLRDAGQPLALYTALISIGSAAILLLEFPVALALRRRAALPVIATGYLMLGLGFLMFGLPVTVWTAIMAMLVLTAGEILYKTTATAHVLDAAPDHLVGQYQGLYTGAATSGTMLAAPIGTAIYASFPALLWPLCAVAGGVAALMALSCRPRTRPLRQPAT